MIHLSKPTAHCTKHHPTTPRGYTMPRSGTPILTEAYTDETAAIDRAEELITDTNPEYDEVDVFDAQLK